MNYIYRDLQKNIEKWLFKGKVISIYGARQVGKTTLSKHILKKYGNEKDYYNCEIINVGQIFQKLDILEIKENIGNAKIIVLDEAQKIPNIGVILKLLHDTYPDLQIIATGSSSFDLSNKTNEPLTGRGLEFILYPFSVNELKQIYKTLELKSILSKLMIYGSYPEIFFQNHEDARLLLDNLTSKYLYKDVFEIGLIKRPDVIIKLLQMLAFQIGNEVSKNELADSLTVNVDTIERYLHLLDKAFVIFRLKPFSRNLRKEINKKEKIYFYDLGIRNSLIGRYNNLEFREDIGALWENFCIVERLKYRQRNNLFGNIYFWRTHDQKEVDFVEDYNGILHGFEFKWSKNKAKIPKEFLETYKGSTIEVINKDNYLDFVTAP